MVDVIIPAYNAHEYIKDALSSLMLQTYAKKLKVYIVDDCSDKGYDEEIKEFEGKLNITVLKTPKNGGPGVARQYGMDNSDSWFIMFLDADDVLVNIFAIEDLVYCLNRNASDVAGSSFIEQGKDYSITRKNNNIWMHGKIYRRSFIEDNNIKFNKSYANEDTGFNTLVYLCADKIDFDDEITYLWKYNEKSITKKNNGEFQFYGLEGFLENICWAVKEAEKREKSEVKIAKVIYETMIEMYYNYIKFNKEESKKQVLKWCRELKELYKKYEGVLDDKTKFDSAFEIVRKGIAIASPEKVLSNQMSFYDFLEKIK